MSCERFIFKTMLCPFSCGAHTVLLVNPAHVFFKYFLLYTARHRYIFKDWITAAVKYDQRN